MCFPGALARLKTQHQEDPNSSTLVTNKPTLLRSLFTVGALCRHFDFDQEEFKGANKVKYLQGSPTVSLQPPYEHVLTRHCECPPLSLRSSSRTKCWIFYYTSLLMKMRRSRSRPSWVSVSRISSTLMLIILNIF